MAKAFDQVHGILNPRLEMVLGELRLRGAIVRGRREVPKGARVVVTVTVDGVSQDLIDFVENSGVGQRSVLNVAAIFNNQLAALVGGPAEVGP